MKTKRLWIILVLAVIVFPILWYLGSPLFLNKQVNEAFPMSEGATVPQGMTKQQVEEEMMKASKTEAMASEGMPAAQGAATVVVTGTFGEVDKVHKAEGKATVYKIGNDLVLRLDPFKSTNGPDLYVYLSSHAAPRSREQLHDGGSALEVSRLKGNVGSQNYTLPAGADVSKYKSAVIYCRRFHVVFSTASLAAN